MKFKLNIENNLKLTRSLVYFAVLISFLFFFQSDFSGWIQIIPESAWTPVGITEWLHPIFKILKNSSLAWVNPLLTGLFVISTLSCVLNWQIPTMSVISLVLSLIFFGLKNSFGHAYRTESVLIIAQFILTLHAVAVLNSHQTVQALRTFWISIFFLSGLNKLFSSGFEWVTDNYVLDYIKANQITRAGVLSQRPLAEFAKDLINYPSITKAIGLFIFCFEIFYPIILFKKMRLIMLLLTVVFQIAVFIILGVNFFLYLPLLPIWLSSINEKTTGHQ